jgi:hypothetical protein
MWEPLAVANIPGVIEGHDYRISVDLQMETGGVMIQLVSGAADRRILETLYQEVPVKRISKVFVFHAGNGYAPTLSVGAWNVFKLSPISVTVGNPVVQEVQLAR